MILLLLLLLVWWWSWLLPLLQIQPCCLASAATVLSVCTTITRTCVTALHPFCAGQLSLIQHLLQSLMQRMQMPVRGPVACARASTDLCSTTPPAWALPHLLALPQPVSSFVFAMLCMHACVQQVAAWARARPYDACSRKVRCTLCDLNTVTINSAFGDVLSAYRAASAELCQYILTACFQQLFICRTASFRQ